jgi:hypothetical protein
MAKEVETKVKITFPAGVASYAWLNKPDEFRGSLDYKVTVAIDPSEGTALVDGKRIPTQEALDFIRTKAQEEYDAAVATLEATTGKDKGKALKKIDKLELHLPFSAEYDDNGDETGKVLITPKSKAGGVNAKGEAWKRTINMFDATGKHIKPEVAPSVYGGSIIAVEVVLNNFYASGLDKAGCNFYINAVQIVELKSGSGGGSAEQSGFGAVEGGYVAPEAPAMQAPAPEDDSEEEEEDF